jgi:hypothetical protein
MSGSTREASDLADRPDVARGFASITSKLADSAEMGFVPRVRKLMDSYGDARAADALDVGGHLRRVALAGNCGGNSLSYFPER